VVSAALLPFTGSFLASGASAATAGGTVVVASVAQVQLSPPLSDCDEVLADSSSSAAFSVRKHCTGGVKNNIVHDQQVISVTPNPIRHQERAEKALPLCTRQEAAEDCIVFTHSAPGSIASQFSFIVCMVEGK
jgi:hypothetical protein